MSYYIVYQLEKPCYQLVKIPSVLWAPRDSLIEAINEYQNPDKTQFVKEFDTIDARIAFLTSNTRSFSYYGPFDTVDNLLAYLTNIYPEAFI